MINEEQYLRQHLKATENPFRVPEDYFDNFVHQMMATLPDSSVSSASSSQNRRSHFRRWMLYAAAGLVLTVLTVTAFYKPAEGAESGSANGEVYADNYVDEAVDYVMADNQDIYACLMEE